ncbi:hypothetical protein D9Q98_004291 [Chlorella vulgaris]|uniref:BZIP domain-containing protein n=1 Tax=Chlorella vulgaris TaxID=3077 RepID=A0A9D4TS36_CHLVU|nr:hypothetical protein D9Q98_004291 [Chlorella vulgaris]
MEDEFGDELGYAFADFDEFFVAPPPPCPALFDSTDGSDHYGLLPPLDLLLGQEMVAPPPAPALPDLPAHAASDTPPEAVDKAEVARQKNRLAQRRFREKERQRQAQVQGQAEMMEAEMAALRLENAGLAHQQRQMERTLSVRDAMLAVVPPPSEPAAAPAAAAMAAPPPGPPHGQMAWEELSWLPMPQQQQQHGQAGTKQAASYISGGHGGSHRGGGGSGGSGESSLCNHIHDGGATSAGGSTVVCAALPAPAQALMPTSSPAPPARADSSSSDDDSSKNGQASLQLQAIGAPRLDKVSLRRQVQHEVCGVGNLVQYWREQKHQLAGAFVAAESGGFKAEAALTRLEDKVKGLAEFFWYAAQLKPQLFRGFLAAALPPPDLDLAATWASVARRSLNMLTESEVLTLRQSWQRYNMRSVVAAVGTRPWLKRLQEVLQLPDAAEGGEQEVVDLRKRHLKVTDMAARLSTVSEERYTAAMAFLLDVGAQVSAPVRCLWHLSIDQYLPDHPAIVSEILRLYQQQQQLQQRQLREGAAGPPPPGVPSRGGGGGGGGRTSLSAWTPPPGRC